MSTPIRDRILQELVPADGEGKVAHGMPEITVPPAAMLGLVRRLEAEFRLRSCSST